jgi:hypothetical protein
MGDKRMRVLAARFPGREQASAALGDLNRRFALKPSDVGIAPLAIPEGTGNEYTLLAGRFPEDRTAEVDRVVREAGGEIVADVDERWTRPHIAQRHRDAEPETAVRPH